MCNGERVQMVRPTPSDAVDASPALLDVLEDGL